MDFFDEILEQLFQMPIDEIRRLSQLESKSSKVYVVDFEKMKSMIIAAKQLGDSTGLRVSYGRMDIMPNVGFVSIEGRAVNVKNIKLFADASSTADNVEIIATLKGIRVTFTYYDAAQRVKM